MERMLSTRTGLYFYPVGTKTSDDEFINTEEGEFFFLYSESEHAKTQAALAAAEEAISPFAKILGDDNWPDALDDEHLPGSLFRRREFRKAVRALKLIRDAKGAEDAG